MSQQITKTNRMETISKNTILVPVDFSEIADFAVHHAVSVAKHFNNNIALLHVLDESFFSGLFSFGKNEKQEELAKEAITARMQKLANEIEMAHNIKCSINIRSGKIYAMIAEVAQELKCDSIIMGSNGASGMGRIIGSNSSRTIIESKVPVVVVKSAHPSNGYKNIVFPLDLTLESRQKTKWAIHLGKSYKATIRIFTFKTNDEILDNKIAGSLHQVESMLNENGVAYTVHVKDKLEDDFATETIKYAEEINGDLMMIMTQTEDKDFVELIFGTYAQQIVNASQKIPVMCINPNKTGIVGGWGY